MTTNEQKSHEQFMKNWRMSEFYPFVMNIVDSELSKSYVQDVMTKRIMDSEPMDNNEIAEEMKLEVKSNLRIKGGIRDVLA